eukprot:scaffold219773_cov17-Tisochrysis_lutea.AAC.1
MRVVSRAQLRPQQRLRCVAVLRGGAIHACKDCRWHNKRNRGQHRKALDTQDSRAVIRVIHACMDCGQQDQKEKRAVSLWIAEQCSVCVMLACKGSKSKREEGQLCHPVDSQDSGAVLSAIHDCKDC